MDTIGEPMPQIHTFSDGYYLVNGFYVEPSEDVQKPVMQDHVYATLQEQYGDSHSSPVLFRHAATQYHFQIDPAEHVRSDTIEMPYTVVDQLDLDYVPSDEQFLMAKPGHAETIIEMTNTDTTHVDDR